MRWPGSTRFARTLATAAIAASLTAAPAIAAEVILQPDTKGCQGVLPSSGGNTDMSLVGGTLIPGGTAVFEITYPLDGSDVGKHFAVTACAFIDGVATLKYLVTFVPSNETFRLRMTFAVPVDAPVGGEYCNYSKTTRSPTAAQASQRKAGPSCFIIRGPGSPGGDPPDAPRGPGGGAPPLIPDTAMASR